MNHDVAHCLNYCSRYCPSSCPKAQLEKDLKEHPARFIGMEFDYMDFIGTAICQREEANDER